MVIDPAELAIFTIAGGAVTAKFVNEAWDLGKNWLNDYFLKHQPEAQEKAQENALAFLFEMGTRIQELEKQTEDNSFFKKRMEQSLSDPDFSALLQDALISSARTSSEEKHNLLAHVVSDRLLAEQESLKALATRRVVDVIPHISSKQLKFLGLMAVIMWRIIPTNPPNEMKNSDWADFIIKSTSPLIPTEEIVSIDYMHLVSVSCIYRSVGSRKIDKFIKPPEELCSDWKADILLKETDVGRKINQIWEDGMKRSYLTSIGGLVGIYVHDELTGTKTDLKNIYGI